MFNKVDIIGFILDRNDKRQEIRLRRVLYALYGAAIHTIVCLLMWIDSLFRTSWNDFILLFLTMWVIHVSFFVIIRTGLNKKFSDPSLTVPMMLWCITCLMYTVYLTTELRSLLLMFNFFILVFGTFHLGIRAFILVTLYGIFSYLGVIKLLEIYHPNFIDLQQEWISFSCFSLVSFAYIVVASEMAGIRSYIHDKHSRLLAALEYIESISMTDELTGIKNRRYILNALEDQKLMAERGNYVFSVCILDIDFFKNINDTYGHPVGDKVLAYLCEFIGKTLRKIGHFARFGGEEFLLVLPLTDLNQGKLTGERIRKLVESTSFDHIVPDLKVTVSIGVVQYQQQESINALLDRVDKALYVAKNSGRNRVVIS